MSDENTILLYKNGRTLTLNMVHVQGTGHISSLKKGKRMLGRSDQDAKDWVAKAIALYKKTGKAIALSELSKRTMDLLFRMKCIFLC